ncbi:MAG: serine acetyltransferase [Pseudomonadota bacterium]
MASGPPGAPGPEISAEIPDWSRERPRKYWDPGRRLLRTIRRYQAWGKRGRWARPIQMYWALNHRFWQVASGAEIPLTTELGGGLMIPHPNGIVIHPDSRVGPNCILFQQVTLAGGPTLGGHVDVGAGAKILGRITIGDHAVIGANAVVLKDVPPGRTAAGVPARLLPEG